MRSPIPHPFLFRYSFPVRKIDGLPKKGAKLLALPKECTLPELSELGETPPIGELRAAWNAKGLGFSVTVAGKKHPPACDVKAATESDGLQVWIDTRNTQNIHRASKFCHHFCLLPTGGGSKRNQPIGVQLPLDRSREEANVCKPDQIAVAADIASGGYTLEAWLPAEILHGFDPQATPRVGFYFYLRDSELGDQFLSVGHEFPFTRDPSLWATVELVEK